MNISSLLFLNLAGKEDRKLEINEFDAMLVAILSPAERTFSSVEVQLIGNCKYHL